MASEALAILKGVALVGGNGVSQPTLLKILSILASITKRIVRLEQKHSQGNSMSNIATRSFNLQWASAGLKLVIVLSGLTLVGYAIPVAAQSYQLSIASMTRMNTQDLFNQGVKKTERGDFKSAIKDFNEVLQINPTFIEAYCNRGIARAELGDYKGAMADFDSALSLNPAHADAYDKRGTVRAQMGDQKGALVDFDQALQREPNLVDAYYNRGLAHTQLGNFQEAIADYNQAIRINPTLAEAYGNRGFVHYRLGDKPKAIADFQKAAQLFSDHGNTDGYQQTLNFMQLIQIQPTQQR